jgi:hypothetical protein
MNVKVTLPGQRAAVAMCIDGRRTVQQCLHDAGGRAESPELDTSFCRVLFRDLWRLGYYDLVSKTAIS